MDSYSVYFYFTFWIWNGSCSLQIHALPSWCHPPCKSDWWRTPPLRAGTLGGHLSSWGHDPCNKMKYASQNIQLLKIYAKIKFWLPSSTPIPIKPFPFVKVLIVISFLHTKLLLKIWAFLCFDACMHSHWRKLITEKLSLHKQSMLLKCKMTIAYAQEFDWKGSSDWLANNKI